MSFKQVSSLVLCLIWECVKDWLAGLLANNRLLENVVTDVLIFATKFLIVENEIVPVLVIGLPVYRVEVVSSNGLVKHTRGYRGYETYSVLEMTLLSVTP